MKNVKTEERCEFCNGPLASRMSTMERPYRFDLSGLDNVFLVGVEVEECQKCGRQTAVTIPKMEGLHKAIAKELLAKKDLLIGKEIRFLRKHAGIAANRFAELLRIDPSYLSRVENGKMDNLGAGLDKLARAIYAEVMSSRDAASRLLMDKDQKAEPAPATFGIKRNHWEKLAA